MLVAMRPRDARYLAIPLPAGSSAQDATVGCVLMSWPVINPLRGSGGDAFERLAPSAQRLEVMHPERLSAA